MRPLRVIGMTCWLMASAVEMMPIRQRPITMAIPSTNPCDLGGPWPPTSDLDGKLRQRFIADHRIALLAYGKCNRNVTDMTLPYRLDNP